MIRRTLTRALLLAACAGGGANAHDPVTSVFELPEHRVTLHQLDTLEGARQAGPRQWAVSTAPRPGLQTLRGNTGDTPVTVQIFTLRAEEEAHAAATYDIGRYPAADGLGAAYEPPRGYIEAQPELANVHVSAHFELAEFLCKQESGWPKYLVLQPRLLSRLEQIVTVLKSKGFSGDSLKVMSGYRTPVYNRQLGNVARSRHLYGDAADIYVDRDGDERMDDLDGDGKVTAADARWLFELIEREAPAGKLAGGLAAYPPTEHHGGFVHVDTRGQSARWNP